MLADQKETRIWGLESNTYVHPETMLLKIHNSRESAKLNVALEGKSRMERSLVWWTRSESQ